MRPLRRNTPDPNDNTDQQHADVTAPKEEHTGPKRQRRPTAQGRGANETPVTGNAARPDPGPMSYGLLSSCDSRDAAVLGRALPCGCPCCRCCGPRTRAPVRSARVMAGGAAGVDGGRVVEARGLVAYGGWCFRSRSVLPLRPSAPLLHDPVVGGLAPLVAPRVVGGLAPLVAPRAVGGLRHGRPLIHQPPKCRHVAPI
jgi:hypothetical protein